MCNSVDDSLYVEVYHEMFRGLYTSIWLSRDIAHLVKETISSTFSSSEKFPNVTLGIGVEIGDTNLCFLNTYLPRENSPNVRESYIEDCLKGFDFGVLGKELANQDCVLWGGCFNSTLSGISSKQASEFFLKGDFFKLLKLDHFSQNLAKDKMMKGFKEFLITWPTTYPYNPETGLLIMDGKIGPAYADRIFYRGTFEPEFYTSIDPVTISPHKAVCLVGSVTLAPKDYTRMIKTLGPEKPQRRKSGGGAIEIIRSIFVGEGNQQVEKTISLNSVQKRKSNEGIVRRKSIGPGDKNGPSGRSNSLSDPKIVFSGMQYDTFDWASKTVINEGEFIVEHIPSRRDTLVRVISKDDCVKIGLYSLLCNLNCPFLFLKSVS